MTYIEAQGAALKELRKRKERESHIPLPILYIDIFVVLLCDFGP